MKFKYRCFWFPYEVSRIRIDHPNKNDHIYENISAWSTFYEETLLFYLASHIKKNINIVDVGANIGNHAVFFGKFMAKNIICFEPHEEHVKYLKMNLAQNAIENAHVFSCALSSTKGHAIIKPPEKELQNSGMTQIEIVSERNDDQNTVETVTLDAILREELSISKIDLLKIDVEGHELSVLEGASETIEKCLPVIVFEANTQRHYEEISAFLSHYNYKQWRYFAPANYVFQSDFNPILRKNNLIWYLNLSMRYLFNFFKRVKRKLKREIQSRFKL